MSPGPSQSAGRSALIVEAALRSGATRLLSEDLRHGSRFGELVVENPFLPHA